MKAYQIESFGIDELKPAELETPRPGPGEVLVRMRAASLNYRDLMVVSGAYNPRMKLPAIPLSDGVGDVEALGDGVAKWQPGDRVMPLFVQHWFEGELTDEKRRTALGAGAQWQGVLREYAVFSEGSLVRVPEHLSYEEASTLPCAALTAWHAVAESGRVRPGETVVTLGSGGVSLFTLQFAKLAGARVIATTGSVGKEARLKELGADEVINYREREDWDAAVLEMTGRRGADHVIEVGGPGTLPRSINAVRVAGHVALIGALSGSGGFSPVNAFMKAVRLQGIFVGSRRMFEEMNEAIARHKLRPVIDSVHGFDEIGEALRLMESGAHFGKIVVKIS